MAYNLPPSWDAGYALPQNVRDEGLERRAFVTKQAPRGTYDAPRVPTGGYTVPPYVVQEGYGQGARTTAWARRGSYAGPAVPQWIQRQPTVAGQRSIGPGAAAVTFKVKAANALSGTDAQLPASYQRFGDRAAAVIMSKIAQLAPEHRKAQLKGILDRLDPTLWDRTAAIAKKYVQQGLTASAAVHMALARAMSTGIAAEIVETGRTSSAPQPNSLLGLGCYGCNAAQGALGDTTVTSNPPPNMTWDASIPPAGAWRRLRAGEVGKPNPNLPGGVTVTTNVHASGSSVSLGTKPTAGQTLLVGPFEIPLLDGKPVMLTASAGSIPPQWIPALKQALTPDAANAIRKQPVFHMPTPTNAIYQRIGLAPGATMTKAHVGHHNIEQGKQTRPPIYVFKYPTTGKDWGVYMALVGDDAIRTQTNNTLNDLNNPTRVKIRIMEIKEKDHPWYMDIGRAIAWVPAKIVDGVKAIAELVADLACTAASSPGAQQAGAQVGVAAGAGASVGAAGAAIAAALCNNPPPAPPPLPPPAPSILPLAMAAGGVVLIAALLSKKGE